MYNVLTDRQTDRQDLSALSEASAFSAYCFRTGRQRTAARVISVWRRRRFSVCPFCCCFHPDVPVKNKKEKGDRI